MRGSNVVHLLLSGATYGHVYWDFPVNSPLYSYTQALNAAGFATFNFDRIGIGVSDHSSRRSGHDSGNSQTAALKTGSLENQPPVNTDELSASVLTGGRFRIQLNAIAGARGRASP